MGSDVIAIEDQISQKEVAILNNMKIVLRNRMEKEKDGLYGFINIKGEWVIEPQFLAVCNFSDGVGVTVVEFPDKE